MKTIKRSEVKGLEFWSDVGKFFVFMVFIVAFFALAGFIVGYTEKAVYEDACRAVVVEACGNTGGCIIKIDK